MSTPCLPLCAAVCAFKGWGGVCTRQSPLKRVLRRLWAMCERSLRILFRQRGNESYTGTGKTVTAMKIINKLFDSGEIRRVVITMYGNDLLDQWAIQIRENYKNKQINYHYASQKMMKDFVMHPDDSILILSRDARNLSKLLDLFDRLPGDYRNDTPG